MMLKDFMTSLSILTIAPVKAAHSDAPGLRRSVVMFPLVGIAQGIVLVASALLLVRLFSPGLSIALVLLLHTVISGGLHIDGLADTLDGIAARGDKTKKLNAMRDSATGPAGTTAIVFSLGIKYLALLSVFDRMHFIFYFTLLFLPAASKMPMITAMRHGAPARRDGLGHVFIGGIKSGGVATAYAILLAFMTGVTMASKSVSPQTWIYFNPCVLALLYAAALGMTAFFRRAFGGLTGDTLGAMSECGEILFLLAAIAWS